MSTMTGPALRRELAAHGLHLTEVTRKRGDGSYEIDIWNEQGGVMSVTALIERIKAVYPGTVVNRQQEIIADWRPDRPRICAAINAHIRLNGEGTVSQARPLAEDRMCDTTVTSENETGGQPLPATASPPLPPPPPAIGIAMPLPMGEWGWWWESLDDSSFSLW